MWLRGYRVIYCPQSVVTHEYSTSRVVLGAAQQTRLVKFHGCKNYILTLVKNLGGRRLAWMLPLHVSLWVGLAGFEMLRGQFRSGGWILRGLGWNLARLGDTLRKRRRVQKARVSPDRALWPRIYRRVTLMYYLRKLCAVPDTGHAKGL
jgi:GT2 family glycosyltransferase